MNSLDEFEEERWRIYFLLGVIAVFILVLAAKLFFVQVLEHDHYSDLAKQEHWREETIPAKRGSILDTNGFELATSVAYESLYANTGQISDPDKIAKALAPVIDVPAAELAAKLANRQAAPVLLKPYLTSEQADAVRKLKIWDIDLMPEFRRIYPEGNAASQLIGLVGKDQGLTGIEAALDKDLAGKPGSLLAERDTGGDEIALSVSQYSKPTEGSDVVLTIDRFIQRVVERQLDDAVTKYQADGGSIVVIEPRTGALLALANRPTFGFADPDLFAPTKAPLYKNAAISDAWEPGSIFKIITMSSGLDTGVVTPATTFNNTGSFAYGGGVVHNVITVTGPENMTQVLQRSSNIGAAFVSTRLGADRFYQYVSAFGLGKATGIELPGEGEGIVRMPQGGSWYPFDLAANAFGQGVAVTPLQMAVAVSAAISGGTLMKPFLIKEVITADGERVYHPTIVRQVLSPETSRTLAGMLVSVVDVIEGGQVRMAKVPGYVVGGKTGTAEIPTETGYSSALTVAAFAGFGPADDPRFVIIVKLDSPRASPWGETTAAPVFKNIAEQLFTYMRIPPSTTKTADAR